MGAQKVPCSVECVCWRVCRLRFRVAWSPAPPRTFSRGNGAIPPQMLVAVARVVFAGSRCEVSSRMQSWVDGYSAVLVNTGTHHEGVSGRWWQTILRSWHLFPHILPCLAPPAPTSETVILCVFLPDYGLAMEDRDLGLNHCRVRGTRMCAALLWGQQAPASRLEFPAGQVQGQLLEMDWAGWAQGAGEGYVEGEITGQVRPC